MTFVCVFVHIYIQLHLGVFLKTVVFYLQFDYVLDVFIHHEGKHRNAPSYFGLLSS